jgi:hypothetical protein
VRKSFGTYTVTGTADNPRITLSTGLRDEPFPIELGTSLQAEFVEPEDDEEYGHLELHPVVDNE